MREMQEVREQVQRLRIEVKELKYILLLTAIRDGKEERDYVLRRWEEIGRVSVGQETQGKGAQGKGKGKTQGKGKGTPSKSGKSQIGRQISCASSSTA
jgi:hypothetical protein